MPIYEYRCLACQHCFEALRFANDDAPFCPACGSPQVERQLSCFATAGGGKSSDLGLASPPSAGGCGSGGFS